LHWFKSCRTLQKKKWLPFRKVYRLQGLGQAEDCETCSALNNFQGLKIRVLKHITHRPKHSTAQKSKYIMSIKFDQVSFLFLCLQHAGGKIDFAGVAKDYQTLHNSPLSKDAAAKRFMRLKEKMLRIGSDGGITDSKKRANEEGLSEETGALKESPLKKVKKEDFGDEKRAVKGSPLKKAKKEEVEGEFF
jgi:hypothetical protein